MDDDALGRAKAATNRTLRNIESPAKTGPYLVEWAAGPDREPWGLTVIDPERFARDDPEGFAKYLLTKDALPSDWEFVYLLPKRLRPRRPEEKNDKANQNSNETNQAN